MKILMKIIKGVRGSKGRGTGREGRTQGKRFHVREGGLQRGKAMWNGVRGLPEEGGGRQVHCLFRKLHYIL
jgi:hypothetical protein